MATSYKCPVCEGRGHIPASFYEPMDGTAIIAYLVTCRSCNGTGVVWDHAIQIHDLSKWRKDFHTQPYIITWGNSTARG